jgi:cell division protease FtsH
MKKKPNILKPLIKNITIVVFVFFIIAGLYSVMTDPFAEIKETSITELALEINEGKVKELTSSGQEIFVTYADDTKGSAIKETNISLSESLINYGVTTEQLQGINISQKKDSNVGSWVGTLLLVLPIILFGFFFYFMLKQAKGGASQALTFTKSKARIFGADGTDKKVSFKDVAGMKEVKEELEEVVEFLRKPKKFLKMGAQIPRGVLLMGSPGTGKTLLGRAIAGEAGVPFFSISGSEFVEMFVGVGAGRVRDLFKTAKKNAPAILFIDELDAVGRHRGAGIGGGNDEREQTLNQILVEMDGFERDTNVIVIAATNRLDILDPALLRPGRFDRKVICPLPSINDREAILQIHTKNKPLEEGVSLREIAERTPGFSGADLANLANEAAIFAARKDKKTVSQLDLANSIEKVLLGPERRSHIISDKEKKITAYHEAGHALASALTPGAEPVRKISIIARGHAAGYTLQVPTEDKSFRTKSEFLAEIVSLLGGYSAERTIFGETTTGTSNDLQRASALARKLIKEYGMSSLGPISFGEKEELVFLGKEISEERNYSEKVAEKIDAEIEKIIYESLEKADIIMKNNKSVLDELAKTLIEKEIIERKDFEDIIKKNSKKK